MTSRATTRILIVDDEPIMLRSFARALRNLDGEVATAPDGGKALEILESQPVDVIVSDYSMPGMMGDELLERVRERWPQTIRLLVTGQSDGEMMEAVVRRGAVYRFLTKPCRARKFLQAVNEALEEGRRSSKRRRETRKRELDLHSYLHLFECAVDPMMFADLDGGLVRVNDAFVRLYGEDKRDALRNRPTLSIGADAGLWVEMRSRLETDGHWSGEITVAGYTALLTVSRVDDETGPYAYAAVEKDVSAHRHLEAEARAAQYEVILATAKLAEYRDPETGAHLERMRRYSRALARQLPNNERWAWIDDPYVEAIFYASPLHDVGKVGIPDAVLLKPGKLTAAEWMLMKRHPIIGADVLAAAGDTLTERSWLSMARTIALQHHEKYDGTGYPACLVGEQIAPSARIVAVADAYDAITSKRVYKAAMSAEEAKERIIAGRGGHFDPDVVDAFVDIEDELIQILARFDDEKTSPGLLQSGADSGPDE